MPRRAPCKVSRRLITRIEGATLVAADPNHRFLAIGTSSGVTLVDAEGTTLRTFDLGGSVDGLDVSPDGAWLAVDVICPEPPIHATSLVSVESGSVVALVPPEPLKGWHVRARFGGDGRLLVLGDPAGLWDVRNPDAPALLRDWRLPPGQRGAVFPATASFSADGMRLAIANLASETITVLDAITFEEIAALTPVNHSPAHGTGSLIFVDGDSKLLTHTTHSTSLWDLATRTKVATGVYETAMKNTFTIGVSSDTRTAVVSFTRGGLIVFDTVTGDELVDDWKSLDTARRVTDVAFLPGRDEFVTVDAGGGVESFTLRVD